MKFLFAALMLALAAPSRADIICPTCIQNTAAPQNAQINIGTATIRGSLTVSTGTFLNLYATYLNVANLLGNGSAITSLNASQLTSGIVSAARIVGSYTGITGLGTIATGIWNGTPIPTQYGGTGQNFVTASTGTIPYFSAVGVMAGLPPSTAGRVLQTNGPNSAPSWVSAPQILGTNVTGIPLSGLSSGSLPTNIAITDSSLPANISAAKINGNIAGGASFLTVPLPISDLAGGLLPTSNPASSITVTGVAPGTYGGPSQLAQIQVRPDGRIQSISQFLLVVPPPIISTGALPSGVTIAAADITSGTLAGNVIASSIAASGVTAGVYGSTNRTLVQTIGIDGRISASSQPLIALPPSQINAGALPAGVTIGASDIRTGNLPNDVVATSVTNSGVAPGTYGGPILIPQITVGNDGRVISATQFTVPALSSSSASAFNNVDNNWSHAQTSQSSWTINNIVQATSFLGTYFGDGSNLTGVVRTAGDTMTGPLIITSSVNSISAVSSITASAFFGNGSALTGMPVSVCDSGGGIQSVLCQGQNNQANGQFATVSGGDLNVIGISGDNSTIAGGNTNTISAGSSESTISGGFDNTIDSDLSVIGGGLQNDINSLAEKSVISGGENNFISGTGYSVIGGGQSHQITDSFGVIGGGQANGISAGGGTIAGGGSGAVNAISGTIGGGNSNTVGGQYATIPGGRALTANGFASISAGGWLNAANGSHSATLGGFMGHAYGDFSATIGGQTNDALGEYSLAVGRQSKANHDGTFVWSDSQNEDYISASSNSFNVRANGGVNFHTRVVTISTNTNNAAAFYAINGSSGNSAASAVVLENDLGDVATFGMTSSGYTQDGIPPRTAVIDLAVGGDIMTIQISTTNFIFPSSMTASAFFGQAATFEGEVIASTFNAVGSAYQVNGVTVIDGQRNIVSPGSVTASGFFGSGVALTDIISSSVPASGVTAGVLGANVVASSIAASGVTPGSFGSASQSLSATAGIDGRLSSLTANNIAISESQVTNLVSDLAAKASTGTDNSMTRADALSTLGASQVTVNGALTMASGSSVTLSGSGGYITGASSITSSGFFGNASGLNNYTVTGSSMIVSTRSVASITFIALGTTTVTLRGGGRPTLFLISALQTNDTTATRSYDVSITMDGTVISSIDDIMIVKNAGETFVSRHSITTALPSGTHSFAVQVKSDSTDTPQLIREFRLSVMEF